MTAAFRLTAAQLSTMPDPRNDLLTLLQGFELAFYLA